MLELIVLSVCINVFLLGFMYNKTKKIADLNDIIVEMSNRYIMVNDKLIHRRKYSTHRHWFADKFNGQDFDDIIDMLLFQYISNYTYGDTIEYPVMEAEIFDDISTDDALAEINGEIPEFLEEDTNSKLDEIVEDIPDYKVEKQEPTYVESTYERSAPSSNSYGSNSYNNSSSDSSSSDSSSSDSSSSDSSSD